MEQRCITYCPTTVPKTTCNEGWSFLEVLCQVFCSVSLSLFSSNMLHVLFVFPPICFFPPIVFFFLWFFSLYFLLGRKFCLYNRQTGNQPQGKNQEQLPHADTTETAKNKAHTMHKITTSWERSSIIQPLAALSLLEPNVNLSFSHLLFFFHISSSCLLDLCKLPVSTSFYNMDVHNLITDDLMFIWHNKTGKAVWWTEKSI